MTEETEVWGIQIPNTGSIGTWFTLMSSHFPGIRLIGNYDPLWNQKEQPNLNIKLACDEATARKLVYYSREHFRKDCLIYKISTKCLISNYEAFKE